MDYAAEFEMSFIARTFALLEQYKTHVMTKVAPEEQYATTLLINCLLGLLILPKEHFFQDIPALPIEELQDWGIEESMIIDWGADRDERRKRKSVPLWELPRAPQDLREIMRGLRNGAAHIRIQPTSKDGQVAAIRFQDNNGFEALVPVSNLEKFVTKLATRLRTSR